VTNRSAGKLFWNEKKVSKGKGKKTNSSVGGGKKKRGPKEELRSARLPGKKFGSRSNKPILRGERRKRV